MTLQREIPSAPPFPGTAADTQHITVQRRVVGISCCPRPCQLRVSSSQQEQLGLAVGRHGGLLALGLNRGPH